jgi:hypothetical protein
VSAALGNSPKNPSSLLPVNRRRVTGKREHSQSFPAKYEVSGIEDIVEDLKLLLRLFFLKEICKYAFINW